MLNSAIAPIPYLHKCTFCNSNASFMSIEKELGGVLKTYGFPYGLNDFETLSYKTYKCPKCGSSDRERLYRLYVEQYESGLKRMNILDFAPSKQFSPYLKARSKNYRSADLLIDNVDDKVDITNMTIYKDNQFDFFVCSHILEHVDNDRKALSELYRVLKKGGRGILMTPIINKTGVQDEDTTVKDVAERWRRFAQDDHVRLYEKRVFIKRVKAAGFVIHIYGFWNLGLFNCIKNGINLKSRLYIVEKKG